VSNLLVVLRSDHPTQPIVNPGSLYHSQRNGNQPVREHKSILLRMAPGVHEGLERWADLSLRRSS
jgi:hypothetical protein